MWRFFLGLSLVLSSVQIASAQIQEPCAAAHYLNHLEATHPGFEAATRQVYDRVRGQGQARDFTLVTIPVVVHLVYQNEEQNLPDSLIEAVLDVLNEDYRRLNADAGQVREDFLPVVDDPFIQFELAGVERVSTTATFELDILGGTLPDNVKTTVTGGSDAWDPEHHLNIWVCNIEGGALLGYAYPPADLSHWPEDASAPSPALDGVVIHYEVFRRTGTFTTSGLFGLEDITVPVRGRTITHEVGHYLGLRHIWGDGLLSIFGIPDCSADDGVEDTPNQGLNSQFSCDPTNNTCEEGSGDLPDMWENFMDYAQEDCQNSFTFGQIEIMRSVLDNERAGLVGGSVSTREGLLPASALQLYPNPATDYLIIQRDNTASATVRLHNAQGQVVKQWLSCTQNRLEVATSSLPAGLYYVQYISREGQLTKAVVVE
ncbi:MAG: M43 family zinc metalloprotease [Lewinella sp.]|jgi:hypothetical protein|uniref:M43 family zinc metalloprotease n=1 Tax=Lewinella sp. TaxID=2004506 RepID=UPI003D6AD162